MPLAKTSAVSQAAHRRRAFMARERANATRAQYAAAALTWEKIKDNLRDHSLYDLDNVDTELAREIDQEQIEVIRAHMGGTYAE